VDNFKVMEVTVLIQSFDETEIESSLAILQLKYNTVNIKNREFIRTQTRPEKPSRRSGIFAIHTTPDKTKNCKKASPTHPERKTEKRNNETLIFCISHGRQSAKYQGI
jgi:hypothetical protein